MCRTRVVLMMALSGLIAWYGLITGSASAQTLKADYQFENTRSSSVGTPPALTDLGSNSFIMDTVDGEQKTVLAFSEGDGLSLAPTIDTIPNDTYSIVILFRFDTVSRYRRILDFKNATFDEGLYNHNGYLNFYDEAEGASNPIVQNTYIQVVLTRDLAKNVAGYVNGVLQFSFVDASDLAVIDGNNTLRFFRDDNAVSGEHSGGAVARIRLYDGALSDSQVAALDRLPSGPSPMPHITVTPNSLTFDAILAGQTTTELLTIHNIGDADLIVTDINDPFFSVSDTAFTVAPGDSHTVTITFAPATHGTFPDTLMILSNDPAMPVFRVPVSGTALRPGDLTRDTSVNILDIIALVRLILGQNVAPAPGSLSFALADANEDGELNILDIVRQVNLILGIQPKVIVGPISPVTVSLGEVQPLASGQLAIPVTMQADGTIAGVQATFTFDPAQLQVGTPQLTGRADGMTLMSQVTDGTLRLIVYSATGQGIPGGSGTTLLVPVTVSGGASAAPALILSQVILANRQAHAVPVTLGTSTVKVSALPTAFALKPNRPNPFNPTTQIAYEVPQAAHITLAVYNLLGQEVIRLVDEQKAPGRYVVTWAGRNAQGLGVASGVYLYRLTTSAGFSQTKRMTLLK